MAIQQIRCKETIHNLCALAHPVIEVARSFLSLRKQKLFLSVTQQIGGAAVGRKALFWVVGRRSSHSVSISVHLKSMPRIQIWEK